MPFPPLRSSPLQVRQDTRPTPRALAIRGQVVLLIRRMDAVVVETEPDEQRLHAELILERLHDRNGAAHADQRRGLAPLVLKGGGSLGDVRRERVEGNGGTAAATNEFRLAVLQIGRASCRERV